MTATLRKKRRYGYIFNLKNEMLIVQRWLGQCKIKTRFEFNAFSKLLASFKTLTLS
jgi:hypothetical protein